jgi:hypothetical protein
MMPISSLVSPLNRGKWGQAGDQGPSRHSINGADHAREGRQPGGVLKAYAVLEPADIDACLLYAARLSELAAAEGLSIAAE